MSAIRNSAHRTQSPIIFLFKDVPNSVREPLWKWKPLQRERSQKKLEGRTWESFIWYRNEAQYKFCVERSWHRQKYEKISNNSEVKNSSLQKVTFLCMKKGFIMKEAGDKDQVWRYGLEAEKNRASNNQNSSPPLCYGDSNLRHSIQCQAH